MIVTTPQGHDVNSWLVSEGRQAVLDLIPDGDHDQPGDPGDPRGEAPQEGETEDEQPQHYDDEGNIIPF